MRSGSCPAAVALETREEGKITDRYGYEMKSILFRFSNTEACMVLSFFYNDPFNSTTITK